MSKTVTIPEEEYNDLLDDAEFLRALRMAGVDNWDGYDDAIEQYQEILLQDFLNKRKSDECY